MNIGPLSEVCAPTAGAGSGRPPRDVLYSDRISPFKECMVYGFDFCDYQWVGSSILLNGLLHKSSIKSDEFSDILRVFSYDCFKQTYGNSSELEIAQKYEAEAEGAVATGRKCKLQLLHLVIENVHRQRKKMPLIPLFYCYSYEFREGGGSSHIHVKPKIYKMFDTGISSKELRLLYKMMAVYPDAEVRNVLKESLHFLHVHKNDYKKGEFIGQTKNFKLYEVSAPWEEKEDKVSWEKLWAGIETKKVPLEKRAQWPKWAQILKEGIL